MNISKPTILIDTGSTKTAILCLNPKINEFLQDQIVGYNPLIASGTDYFEKLNSVIPNAYKHPSTQLIFGGAGLISPTIKGNVKDKLSQFLGIKDVEVVDDLEIIPLILNISSPCIVAILGTGSSAAFYDGKQFTDRTVSGGYLLGDEGSAYILGKALIIHYLRGKFLPENQLYLDKLIANKNSLITDVYQSPHPNRFIAYYAKLLNKINDPLADVIIQSSFNSFIEKRISTFTATTDSIYLFGSIALHFQDFLIPLLNKQGFKNIHIEKSVIEYVKNTFVN